MLKLFYTGCSSVNQNQNSPYLSIGGRPSIDLVKNGIDNSIFSKFEIFSKIKKREIICLSLLNDSNNPVNNVSISINSDFSFFNYKAAAQNPLMDECSLPYFQLLNSNEELPLGLNFSLIDNINKLSLGNMLSNQIVGLWIYREINNQSLTLLDNKLTCESIKNDSLSSFLKSIEFSIEIEYN